MSTLAKDYFIKRVETQKRENRSLKTKPIIEATFTMAGIAVAAVMLGNDEHSPTDITIMQNVFGVLGLGVAALKLNSLMENIQKRTKTNRNEQTPAQKAKVYTRNLQREIVF